jgi:two-component system chemotaxis response regulator CheB
MNKFNLNNSYKAVVIGGSAGSFQVIIRILAQLPQDFPLPVIMCLHRLKHVRNGFVEALSLKSKLQVSEPTDKETIKKGAAYLAPANYHMSVEIGNSFALSTEEMLHSSRPAIDITLGSAAFVFKEKLIGILLSGANRDGAAGMKKVAERGGLTIVQEPAECVIDTMPKAALAITKVDHVLSINDIVGFFLELDKKYR